MDVGAGKISIKIRSEQIRKTGKSEKKPKIKGSMTESRAKCSDRPGMETDQEEQLDALLNQSTKVLNNNCETEETDVSSISKRENRFSSPSDNQDTQTEIVIVDKGYTSPNTSR